MAKNRKKIFPKPPVKFHSKLEKELGKWSNKNCPLANLLAIYNQDRKQEPKLNDRQAKQLQKLRDNLAKRG